MTNELSNNEKVVFELVFKNHDPDIKTLCTLLKNELTDKRGDIVQEEPDTRFVSKLKSTGLKKISQTLSLIAKTLSLDIKNNSNKYSEKVKACLYGLNFMLNTESYLIYTISEGPIVWYVHESKTCKECIKNGKCVRILNIIIHERNITLSDEFLDAEIDKRAKKVFEIILQ